MLEQRNGFSDLPVCLVGAGEFVLRRELQCLAQDLASSGVPAGRVVEGGQLIARLAGEGIELQRRFQAGDRLRHPAENGEEGVRKAKAMKPDLIFMDIVMPGVNGYQATRMLINDPETSLIPIIMVTTKGQETDRVWGLRQGAVDYLVKPVSAQALVEKAQAALAQ